MKPGFTIPPSLGSKYAIDTPLDKAAKEVAKHFDDMSCNFTKNEIIRIVKELLSSGDITLLEAPGNRFGVLYIPYSGIEQLRSSFNHYKELVNSILNEDQRAELARKLQGE